MEIPVSQVRASGGGAPQRSSGGNFRPTSTKLPSSSPMPWKAPPTASRLLAGVGMGVWDSVEQACKACIRQTSKVPTSRKMAVLYDRSFATYDKLYFDLKPRFAEIAALDS